MHSKESVDLLITPRWLLRIAPDPVPLSDHAVAVTDGRIVAVGGAAELGARFEAREQVERPDHVLMPGFVNAHTRASMSLFRGLPAYAPLLRWMREIVWPAELRVVGPDFVREGTQLAMAEMLRAGITTFADSYLFPDEAARTAAAARVRAVIGLPVSETGSAWAENSVAHFARAERVWDEYRLSPWISLYFAPPPSYAIGDATLARLRSVADELDARIAMPVHETEIEVRDTLSHHGRRPLQRLADLGLLRPGFTAIGMNWLDAGDFDLAQRTGISVVACPTSDLRLGSGSCPVSALSERGVVVGLGTASPASAGAFDLLAEAKLAAQLIALSHAGASFGHAGVALGQTDVSLGHAGASLSHAGVSFGRTGNLASAFSLSLATLGGAVALGLGDTCGSVEVGKAADLICIDLAEVACETATVADAVLFSATRQHVTDVWVGGRAAMVSGQLLAFDEQELRRMAQHWKERIRMGNAA